MAGLLLRTIWLLYLRDNPAVELMILVAAIIYMHIYIYIYILYYIYMLYIVMYMHLVSIYICMFVYFYIGQSFKEVNLAAIKNCLSLVVKVKSLKSITSRQFH